MPSKPEIRRIVEGYAQSGMTRREYCLLAVGDAKE